eukprot:scaffold10393_cov72-Skeletonema_dohrnii-CCMP3373.AAC.1
MQCFLPPPTSDIMTLCCVLCPINNFDRCCNGYGEARDETTTVRRDKWLECPPTGCNSPGKATGGGWPRRARGSWLVGGLRGFWAAF